MSRRFAILACLLATGCSEGSEPTTFDFRVFDRAGGNPITDAFDTAIVRVRQGTLPVETLESEIRDRSFVITRPLVTPDPIAFTVELRGPSERLYGAPPPFRLSESGGYVAVPMGAPSSCGPLTTSELAAPRAFAAVVRLGTFALVAGGRNADGDAASLEFLDLLRVNAGDLPDLSRAGAARGAPLDARRAVFVLGGVPRLYDLAGPAERELTVPSGLSGGSAILARRTGGAVLVGGGSEGEPSDPVTFVATDGTTRTTRLAVPRFDPAVVEAGSRLFVAGGTAPGRFTLEEVAMGDAGGRVLVDVEDLGDRRAAILAPHPEEPTFLLLGGRTETGEPRSDTLVLRCGASACSVESGPVWEEPRSGFAAVVTPEGTWLVGGRTATGPSGRVDRITFDGGSPTIVEQARLAAPREGAGAFVNESGVLYVVGGADASGPRRDVEHCIPEMLFPL